MQDLWVTVDRPRDGFQVGQWVDCRIDDYSLKGRVLDVGIEGLTGKASDEGEYAWVWVGGRKVYIRYMRYELTPEYNCWGGTIRPQKRRQGPEQQQSLELGL